MCFGVFRRENEENRNRKSSIEVERERERERLFVACHRLVERFHGEDLFSGPVTFDRFTFSAQSILASGIKNDLSAAARTPPFSLRGCVFLAFSIFMSSRVSRLFKRSETTEVV